jgi:hypothetical protein
MGRLTNWIPRMWSNWVSLAGVVVTTVTGVVLLLGLVTQLAGPTINTYALTFILLVAPMVFLFGLALIPLGMWLDRRKTGRPKHADTESLQDSFTELLGRKGVRNRLIFVGALTILNIALLGGAGHEAVQFMDSPKFCGTVCHEVMAPEYEAYLRSPHARVKCVECHIGEGASWAVKAKIDGIRQVWGVMTDDFHRPIPTPVHTLRPARDTCEKCHWTAKFHGNRIITRIHTQEDEQNTAVANVLLLKVGGQNQATGRHEGIHWHVSPDVEVRYEALDEKREKIGRIDVVADGAVVVSYLPPEANQGTPHEQRTMDCVDCHNRPTHKFDGPPVDALDFAFSTGLLDRRTRWLRKLALPLLEPTDRNREGVEKEFRAELEAAYKKEHPDALPSEAALDAAANGLAELYRRNVWPTMKIEWDTYPTHLGHRGDHNDVRGCFRCHNDEHETADGKTLSQDCEMCHEQLADEEPLDDLDDSLKPLLISTTREE